MRKTGRAQIMIHYRRHMHTQTLKPTRGTQPKQHSTLEEVLVSTPNTQGKAKTWEESTERVKVTGICLFKKEKNCIMW